MVLFYGYFLFIISTMLTRPRRYFEWSQWSRKWWGIKSVIDDEGKFARRCRFAGSLLLVAMILHATLAFRAIFKN